MPPKKKAKIKQKNTVVSWITKVITNSFTKKQKFSFLKLS